MKGRLSPKDIERERLNKVPGNIPFYDVEDAYDYFNRSGRNKWKLNIPRYRDIIRSFHKILYRELLDGNIVKLPNRMGYFFIYKTEVNLDTITRFDIDEKLTKKHKKTVYNLREETGGYKPVIAHIRKKKGFKYGKMYQFKFYTGIGKDLERRFKAREVDFPAFNNRKEVMDYVRDAEIHKH